MAKCSVTGSVRPKRHGVETVKQRRQRQRVEADKSRAEDIRVVRKRGPAAERVVVGFRPQRKACQSRLRSLLKLNQQIKALQARADAGSDLDCQQRRKLARRDEVLLEIDEILTKGGPATANFANGSVRPREAHTTSATAA